MVKYIFLLAIPLFFFSCKEQKKETTTPNDIYKKYNLQKADDLVIDAFLNTDIVLIGENHFIAEHVQFVADIIPRLHKNGINILYSEFISLDYSPQINELINAEIFDEQKAKNLLMLNLWDWPYKEYLELYRSAWALNKTITEGPKFRIIGLDRPHDYTAIQSPEDWEDPEKRKAFFVDWEDKWAERVINETTKKGQKALIYCGRNHAITYYHQPIIIDGKFSRLANTERVGQYLYKELGGKCTFFSFHIPWDSKDGRTETNVVPLAGKLDLLVDSLPENKKSYGFYTQTSPLGKITDTAGYYANGYPNFNLSQFCDGYLVTTPICDLSICEFIPNFIDSSNIAIVQPQIKTWENIANISIKAANDTLKNRHIKRIALFDANKALLNCK